MHLELEQAKEVILARVAELRGVSGAIDLDKPQAWFHSGQLEAWGKEERVIGVISGTQGGKSVFGPWWLLREIQRRGPGDYAIVGHHKTVFEIDPAPADLVDLVKELGPRINQLFQRMNPASGAEVLGLQAPKLRIGVWPGDGRA